MHEFELIPHQGIGPLKLGMTVAQAQAAVAPLEGAGECSSRENVHSFFAGALQFEIGDSGKVQFIGIADHPSFLCRYLGRDIFDTPAPELFEFIAQHDEGAAKYRSTEYRFPKQVITLYEADAQYDRKGNETRPIWSQVGVGNAEYVASIRALRDG